MNINLPDDLIERLKEHLRETKNPQPMEAFIEEAVDHGIEIYPWFTGDICVHSEECMHHKSVGDWREDHEHKD